MRHCALLALCTAVLLLSFRTGWTAEEAEGEITVETLSSPEKCDAIFRDIRQRRARQTKQVLQVLEDAEPNSRVQLRAIWLAAALRTEEAIPWLIKHITRVRINPLKANPGYHQLYPCTTALVQIGKPASEAALKAVAEEDNFLRRGALVYVMKEVEGQVVAALILEREIASHEGDPKAQGRLRKALSTEFSWWGVPLTYPDRWPTQGDLRW